MLHTTCPFQCYCFSFAQSCQTLCNPMNCSTPGFPVPHHLPKFALVHIHCIGDAFQPSHSLTPSSSALNLSKHQGLFQWDGCLHQMTKILKCFSFSISPSDRYSGLISLKIDWLISLQSKGISGVFSSITDQRHQFFNVPFQCTYWKKSTKRSSHVFNTCFMSHAFTCFNHLLDSTVRKILVSPFYRESTSRFTDDRSLTEGTYLLVAEPEFEPGLPVKPQCSHSSCPIV